MEFDKLLADLLPRYRIVWDRSRKDFRDNHKKNNAFKALAEELNSTVDIVTARYKAIREKYRKEKIRLQELTRSGAGAVEVDSWELFQSLTFFDGIMLSRKRASNIPMPETSNRSAAQAVPNDIAQNEVEASQNEASQNSVSEESTSSNTESLVFVDPEDIFSTVSADLMSPTTSTATLGSVKNNGRASKRRKIESDFNNGLHDMLKTIQDTAASLRVQNEPVIATPSRFDWLGKYMAATLTEIEPAAANEKCNQLLSVLLNK